MPPTGLHFEVTQLTTFFQTGLFMGPSLQMILSPRMQLSPDGNDSIESFPTIVHDNSGTTGVERYLKTPNNGSSGNTGTKG